MKRNGWTLAAAAGALASASAPAAAPEPPGARTVEALRARCPTTRNLAPAAFDREPSATAAELDQRQQRIRGALRAEGPPPEAEVVLRAFAGGSMTQNEPNETATLLWRLPDGRWHFVAAHHYPNRTISPPPPPAILSADEIEAARRAIVRGSLDRGQAAALDALLADPCLEAEPSIAGYGMPLRAGVEPMDPCFDAVPQTVELVRGGRRRVFVQSCRYFLAGELIGLALYPRREGSGAEARPSQTLASPESARRYADQVLQAAHGGEAWINVTDAAGGYAFVHRASGFRCAAREAAEIQIFGAPGNPAADGGRCVRNSFTKVRSGTIASEWEVARRRSAADLRRRVREAADDWFSGHHGSEARRRILMGTARHDGLRMVRAQVAGERRVDARDDELTVVLGAEHDGWVVVARATGSATNPAAVEAAALREWRSVVATRASAPRG